MNYYVSTPTGRECLAVCRRMGFREFACPVRTRKGVVTARDLTVRLSHFALDNGAWIYHVAGVPSDFGPFLAAMVVMGPAADFVVAPDVVAGGLESLRISDAWIPRCLDHAGLVLVPVQDGIEAQDVAAMLGERVGIFVGGSYRWKWTTVDAWAALARERQCYIHVGRVNSAKRSGLCADLGVHSADGSTVSRFSKTARRFIDSTDPNRSGQGHLPW